MTSKINAKAGFVLSLLALLWVAPAGARTNELKALHSGQLIVSNTAPLAYKIFCRKNAAECRGGGASRVGYSKELMKTLYATNRDVNRRIRYRSERGDLWQVNTRSGDCEDYALTKRSELVKAGVPAGALRMAVVLTRGGIGHAVLVVRTSRGDLVLDNRRSSIRTRQKSGYHYLKMATSNPRRWVSMVKAR